MFTLVQGKNQSSTFGQKQNTELDTGWGVQNLLKLDYVICAHFLRGCDIKVTQSCDYLEYTVGVQKLIT